LQALTLPVDVIECELGDLVRAQTICHQQKKDGVVPPSADSSPVNHRQQSEHFIPGYGPWHIDQAVLLRHFDCSAQDLSNDTFSKAETQKDTKGAA
jgi:hypothetical protein